MSSVTHGDPEPEESPEEPPRRDRGRRGLPWRRRQDDTPVVGELDGDELDELVRRSARDDATTPEPGDDLASRVQQRAGARPTGATTGDEAIDWDALAGGQADPPGAPATPIGPSGVSRDGDDDDADRRVIAAAFDQGFAEPTPVEERRGLARLRRRGSDVAEVTELRRDADEAERAAADLAEAERAARAAAERADSDDEKDGLLAEATAAREAAEARAREAEAEYQRAAAEQAEQHAAEKALLVQEAAEARQAADAKVRAAEEKYAQLLLSGETGQREGVGRHVAEQAAAAEAERNAAEARARDALAEYEQAALEQQARLNAMQDALLRMEEEASSQARARLEAEQAATAQARARAAAEQVATEQAAARAEAEARATSLLRQAADTAARDTEPEPEAAIAEPDESAPFLDFDPLTAPIDALTGARTVGDYLDEAMAAEAASEQAAQPDLEVDADPADADAALEEPEPADLVEEPEPAAPVAETHKARFAPEAPAERADVVPEAEPEPTPEPEPTAVDLPPVREDAAAAVVAATRSGSGTKRSYHAKRGTDSLAPVALLAALGCAAVLGRQAYYGELTEQLGLSVGLTVVAVALLIYAVRATNSSRIVHLDDKGTLKLTMGDARHVFDLSSPSTALEQVGEPGKRGWKIMVLRRNMSPITIDNTFVDPKSFAEAVRQWKPDL